LTQAYFEQWLRMMLLWEPKGRGQKTPNQPGSDHQQPYCFEFLDHILSTKVYTASSGMFETTSLLKINASVHNLRI